ncbi:MAG TPA: DUF2442 domain-containing protein [Silvibacterium sp.]|nr:DUF2442 domain-containing protein [Silvibacterium sp.]
MRTESAARENSSAALTEPRPQSPWRVIVVEALPGLRLRVAFADGLTGIVDISGLVQSSRAGVFAALADPALFAQVRLEYGVVTWPGDLDLAPDAMHAAIQAQGEWRL